MGNSGDQMVPVEERFAELVEWMLWVAEMGVVHTIASVEVDVVDNYEVAAL